MEAIRSSEMPVNFYRTTWRYIAEYSTLQVKYFSGLMAQLQILVPNCSSILNNVKTLQAKVSIFELRENWFYLFLFICIHDRQLVTHQFPELL
jgi:hypothetical protein